MKRHGRQPRRASHKDNTSLAQDEPTRKSYYLRKRKRETENFEENAPDKNLVQENTRRRCLKNNEQHVISARGRKTGHSKIPKEKQPPPRIQNKETLLKQPRGKNITPKIQPVQTIRLTRFSMKNDQNSKRKSSDSNPSLIQRKTHVKGENLSRLKLSKRNKNGRQRTLCGTPKARKRRIWQGTQKPMLTSKAPEKDTSNQKQKARKQSRVPVSKNADQTKEGLLHSNIQQTTEAKHCRASKAKLKQNSTKTAHKLVTKTDNPLLLAGERPAPDYFSSLFLKKIETRLYPEVFRKSNTQGISISNDNLIWAKFTRCIRLLNISGEVLRTIHLKHTPVFSCCTPSGDLLETQGCADTSKPVITLISRDGNNRVLANLSSHATNLFGILCENETIYVVGYCNKLDFRGATWAYFIVKLSMSGEVQGVYNTEKKYEEITNIISLNGQIIALRPSYPFEMFSLKGDIISSEKINRVCIHSAKAQGASVDNFGNIILVSGTHLYIVHPSLEFMHEIDTGFDFITEHICSTAVDKNNQLWLCINTYRPSTGRLYLVQYLT